MVYDRNATDPWQRGPAMTAKPPTGENRYGRVSVVVVFFGGDDLLRCLDSVLAQPGVIEVILVNNRGGPPWPCVLGTLPGEDRRLSVIHGQGNVGFGAGCALGAARASGEVLLLLNPDCRLAPDTLPRLLALAAGQPDDAWIMGPRLLNEDGSEQAAGRRNTGTPGEWLSEALGLYRLDAVRWPPVNRHRDPLPADPLVEMPGICGAAMLMPLAFYRRLGGFDSGYFLYFEDMALCRAAWRSGGRVLFAGEVKVTHLKARSPVSPLFVTWHKVRSFRRYLWTEFAATTPGWRLVAVWALLSAGLWGRTLLMMAIGWPLKGRPGGCGDRQGGIAASRSSCARGVIARGATRPQLMALRRSSRRRSR